MPCTSDGNGSNGNTPPNHGHDFLYNTQPEQQLFRTCTTVAIGNGSTAKFRHGPWLHGQAPKEIALAVFRLVWGKGLMVAQGLQGRTWMRGLQRISLGEEVLQFVNLWNLVRTVTLTNQADAVT
jgi:hypothetical protein